MNSSQEREQEPVRRNASISFTTPPSSQGSSSPKSLNSPLLVREDEDEDDQLLLFPQFDDSDAETDEYDYYIPHDQRPLSPSRVIILLLAPSLRLGVFVLPNVASARLIVSIPCLILSSVLALFVRHLWVLLAHYVRKVTVEDAFCELLSRFGANRRWRGVAKGVVRTGGILLRALLVTLYIRGQ